MHIGGFSALLLPPAIQGLHNAQLTVTTEPPSLQLMFTVTVTQLCTQCTVSSVVSRRRCSIWKRRAIGAVIAPLLRVTPRPWTSVLTTQTAISTSLSAVINVNCQHTAGNGRQRRTALTPQLAERVTVYSLAKSTRIRRRKE